MSRVIEYAGRQYEFPDNATDDQISAALNSSARNEDGTYGQPPEGAIIHDAGGVSHIAGHPEINAVATPDAFDPKSERDQAVQMEALKQRADAATAGKTDFFSTPERAAMSFTQGQSMNAGDEMLGNLLAAIRHPGGITGTDPQEADKFRNTRDVAEALQQQTMTRNRQEDPLGTIGAELTGGASTAIGLANNGVTLVGNMANRGLSNIIPRIAAGMGEGGLYGALAGYFGANGDNENRIRQARENLPAAVALGGAAVPVTDLISAIIRPISNTIGRLRDPGGQGERQLAEAMARDTTTPADVAGRMTQMAQDGVPEYRMVDAAGRNAQRLGAIAAKTPSEFRSQVVQDMAARQMGQADRVGGYLDTALNAPGDAYLTQDALIAARRTNAQPLYDAAYSQPTPQSQLYTDMAGRQSVADAMGAVRRTAAENQMPISDLFTDVPNPNPQMQSVPTGIIGPDGQPILRQVAVDPTIQVPTVRGWDFVKRELDARVNQLYNTGDTTAATAVRATRDQLREALANDVPGYRDALNMFRDNSNSVEALDAGRQLVAARNPDEATAIFNQVDPANAQLARLGASRELGVKLDNMRSGQDKTQVFDTPNMQGKLDTLVQDPVARAVLDRQLGGERDMVRASRTLLGGSNTVENLIDSGGQLTNNGGALAALLSGNIPRAIGLAAGAAAGRLGQLAAGISPEGANRIGEYLMSNDPQRVGTLADLYRAALARQTAPSVLPALVNPTFNAPRTGANQDQQMLNAIMGPR